MYSAPVFILLSALAPSFTSNADGSDISAFIIGGSEALDGKYPWNLSFQKRVRNRWNHECGAALIADQWVVTASHCVFDELPGGRYRGLGRNEMRIVAGANRIRPMDPDAQTRHFSRVFTPLGQSVVYDVALLELETAVNTTRSDITPILVANGSEPNTTANCMISGWGVTNRKSQIASAMLREGRTNLVTHEECIAAGWPIEFTHLCANGQPKGVTGCYGDSGAPLTCYRDDGTPVLMGLSSFVHKGCLTERPNVFQKISVYRRWLRRYTQIDDL